MSWSWLSRLGAALCATATLVGALAGSAQASGYWNVWQANLPDSGGVRTKTTPPQIPGGTNNIRLSWTSDTHDMHFTLIANDGTWYNSSAFAGYEYGTNTPYDRWIEYFGDGEIPSGVAAAGCQNPSGLSTVFTNCRNEEFV
jgi:surfactin synthase thioesterase subunit